MPILNIYILQDSVTTSQSCGGIFNDRIIANFIDNLPAKEFL